MPDYRGARSIKRNEQISHIGKHILNWDVAKFVGELPIYPKGYLVRPCVKLM